MKNGLALLKVFTILALCSSVFGQDLKYTKSAMQPASFQSFDKEYLGNGGYFNPARLSPKDLEGSLNRFKQKIQTNVNNCGLISCIAMDLVEALLPSDLTRQGVLDKMDIKTLPTFTRGAWGIVAANAENDPDGPDNLFVIVDDMSCRVHALDFLHSKPVSLTSSQRDVLDLLSISVDKVKLPVLNTSGFNDRNREVNEGLSNPRGICTNRLGDFWVADMGKSRVVRYHYDNAKKYLRYIGSLTHLNQPMDVAFAKGFGGFGALLGIANTNGNSVLFVDPNFQGEVDYRSLPQERKGEVNSANGTFLIRPGAIASDPANPDRIYLAHSGRKIVRLQRTDAFGFAYSDARDWPINGSISSLKCDGDGNLYVVDMLSSFIGKYNPSLALVFTSGGFSDGSDAVDRNLKTGFNLPKYLYVGSQDDLYFSERWENYSGLQRFLNWPRFIDKSVSFQLDCQNSLPIEQRSLTFNFELTKKGNVSVRLYKEPDIAGQVHQKIWETKFSGGTGGNSFVVPVAEIGSQFVDNATYSAEFESSDFNHPTESSGLVSHWIHLGAPQFLTNSTAISAEFFNPDLFPAKAEFNVSGEANIKFKMVAKDVTGTPAPSQFIDLGASANYQRIVDGANVATLNISQADLARVPEMKEFVLWAEMQPVPCGVKQTIPFPLAGAKYLRLDRTVPTGSFAALAQPGFNPLVPKYSSMPFAISATDNSDNNIDLNVSVFKASDLTKPVRRGVLSATFHKGDVPISGYWDGIGDDGKVCPSGQYLFTASATDLAGNRGKINSGTFLLDSESPAIALTLPATGIEFAPFNASQALLLTSTPVPVGLSIQDQLPKDLTFRLDKISPQDASVVGSINYGTVFYNGTSWPSTFNLDPGTFPGDGIYGLSVYGTDQVGNSSAENPVRKMASPQIGDVRYIWVDHFAPLLTTKLTKSVIRSGDKTDLIISAYHQGVDKPFDFSYTVALYHGTTKLADYASGKLTPSVSTVMVPFNHGDYLARKGKFTFKVDVTANLGRIGNSQSQSVDLYVDVFPPNISGTDGMTVPRKFFVSGQVGDPNLVNDLSQNGFERYSVYWKEGAITALPSDLSTWKSSGITVPIHNIDRNGPNAAAFPFGNMGDNQEAITSAFGSAALAYVDGGPSGANFVAGNTYTLLVNVKEKGKPVEFTSATTALRSIKVDVPSSLKIDNVDLNGTTSGPISFDAAKGTLRISGSLSGGIAQQALLRLYVYSKVPDLDGDGLAEPIAIRMEKSDVKPGFPYSFQWDGKDGKGSYVKDGIYRIALTLEQPVTGRGEGPFDTRVVEERDVEVATPLRLVEGTLSPTTISSAPSGSGIAGNSASFKYKATKPSYAYLEVQDENGNKLFDVGPERNQDGGGVFHLLSWNATSPANGLPVSEGEYRIRPYAVYKPGDANKYYYDIPDSPEKFYKVTVTSPLSETPELGNFTLLPVHFGNSDAIWASKPNGLLWKMQPVVLNTSVSIKVNGTQTLKRNQSAVFRGNYFRQHTLLQYRAAARFAIERKRQCKVAGEVVDTRTAAGGSPVVQTYSWNLPSVPLSALQGHTTPDRTFTSPDWHLDDGSETPIGPDWGGGDCYGGLGSWHQSYGASDIRWGAIYALDGTLMDVIVANGGNKPPEASNPTGLFTGANFSNFQSSDVFRTTLKYAVGTGGSILSESGNLDEQYLYPGQNHSGAVLGKDFGIAAKIIDPQGYKVTVAFTLPQKGTITFSKPYPYTFTNPGAANEFIAVFQAGPPTASDKLSMPISYTYSLDPLAPVPTVDVPGVPFPFPPKTSCGTTIFPDANNQPNVDIWNPTQAWVLLANGNPDAYFANFGCDYVKNLPLSLTLQPGETKDIPLGSLTGDLILHQVSPQSYLFSNNLAALDLAVNGVNLKLQIQGNQLRITYPVDAQQASRVAWNPPADPVDADPILAANANSVKGYMKVSPGNEIFNPTGLSEQIGFLNPDFTPVGITQSIFTAYAATSFSRNLPMPAAASTLGEAWRKNQSAWKYLLWDDGTGLKGFHWEPSDPKGLDFTSWSPLTFEYIDGSPNQDYEVPNARDNRPAGTFVPEIKALATPKRILPITFQLDLEGIRITGLAACPIADSKGIWEPITIVNGSDVLAAGTNRTLGFWDITNKAGGYYVRILAKDAANKPYQVTGTVKLGTEVKGNVPEYQVVPSPLKQAVLTIPPNSKYSGMMAVNPVNPKNLPGFDLGNVPKGVVVDVTPSGLVFDESDIQKRPQLTFFLRKKDIEAMGGQPDRLGEIGIYYLNEKTKSLEKAAFAPVVYNLDDPSHTITLDKNPVLSENQVLELKGDLRHTSLYGTFSLSTFVTIDPVVPQTISPTISLSGTGSQTAQTGGVYLYVSSQPVWDASATLVGSTSVSSGGIWSWPGFPLPYEGKNYIYASIGAAIPGAHEPTNSVVVTKDGTKPTVKLVSFDPPILGMNATAAQVNVMLSEMGDVTLYIPSIFGNTFTVRTNEKDATAAFSIPLTNLDGGVLDEGEYPVFITANDLVGNLTQATSQSTLAIDRTVPVMQVDPPAFAGRITGTLRDNYKLGEIRVLDQNGKRVSSVSVSGTSGAWKINLAPSDFPLPSGNIGVVGADAAGNVTKAVLIPLAKLFPSPVDSTFTVTMRDNHFSASDGAQPELTIANHSGSPVSGFTLRLWLSREEAPYREIAVDPYAVNPCGIRFRSSIHPDNPNLVMVDILYPDNYSLAPGQATPSLGFGLHFKNPGSTGWNQANDWSWQGISATGALARNVTLYDKDGNLLYGEEPIVYSIPQPPVPPGPDTRKRATQDLRALYFFHEGFGRIVGDISGVGIPMDLTLSGNAEWIHAGGMNFVSPDHNSILSSKGPNPKLMESAKGGNKLSIEAWVRPGNLTQSYARILEYGAVDGALERNWEMLQVGKNLEFRLRTASASTVALTTANNPISAVGRDYHIVMTYEPYASSAGTGGMRIYLDGSLIASNQECQPILASGTNAWSPNYGLFIGNLPCTLDKDWSGIISMVAIYSKSLSSAEIAMNKNAGILEPPIPVSLFAGIACRDRLLPSDIIDGQALWLEDKAADGNPLKLGNVTYARGLGGKAGSSGTSSFLIYDLGSEAHRLGLGGVPQRATGFVGGQSGGTSGVNSQIKISRADRKPTDQDWLNGSGSVVTLFTSNGADNVPVEMDLGGAKWLFLGQQAPASSSNPLGDFADLRVRFSDAQSGTGIPDYVSGLQYKYYEGTWDWLPDFKTLAPVQQGLIDGFDIKPRLKEDRFAFVYEGFVRIASAGTYTFYTNSDDGSQLFIDNQLIVQNDGLHGLCEKSGTVFLGTGMHSIRVAYFEKDGDNVLQVDYQGPGVPRAAIPSAVLFRPSSGSATSLARVETGLQSLYLFQKKPGPGIYDLAPTGIPLDLNLTGSNLSWIEGGGAAFIGSDHNTIFENRTPNQKLFNSITQSGEFTVEAWLETGNTSQGNSRRILEYGHGDGADERNFALTQEGRNLQFKLRNSTGTNTVLETTNQPLNGGTGRYHVVLTYKPNGTGSDGGQRIYVNGALQTCNGLNGILSATGTNAWKPDYVFAVGNRPGSLDRDWEGKLYLLAVYSRALSAAQVQTNFQAGFASSPTFETLPLGVTSETRLLPAKIQDGSLAWQEDISASGDPLKMGNTKYRTGVGGKPQANGALSWLLYDLEREKSELGIQGYPQRMTGFTGVQDATGTAQLFVKTSSSSSEPTLSNWVGNSGGVVQRFYASNSTNVPINLDISGARWLWVGQSATDASNMGQGILGQAKIDFGPKASISMSPMLSYRYFEGSWDALPDYDGLVPTKAGLIDGFSLSPKNSADNFGFEFKGFLKLTAAGQYAFFTNSDDGSRLWVDGVELVNNDGLHGMRECSGSATLSSGYHAIKVRFFEKSGGEGLDVSFQGPGIDKQKIPAEILFHSDAYAYGLAAKYFEGYWNNLPNFENLVPVSADIRNNARITPRNRNDGFGFSFDGNVFIPTGGDYTFFTNSDDGSRLFVDGSLVVDNDGCHAMSERSGTINLAPGFHGIRILFFENSGGEGLDVKVQGPGIAKSSLPSEMLFNSSGKSDVGGCAGTKCTKDGAISLGGENLDRNYDISNTQWFRIPLAQLANTWAKSVVVALDDMNGRPMQGVFQFEGGAEQTLNAYFQSFPLAYTGQNDGYFLIKVPEQRLYKVRWWFQ